ncbi:MAG: hypothetical protein MI923_18075, partial [Phycisphaerales bacterium]|nr:hypothetical protein [Phycisphaerales bacterium]
KFDKIVKKHNIFAVAVVQANENKLRSGRILKKPEELKRYRLGLEDIYGGTTYAKKSRVVLSIQRPLHQLKQLFPEHEMMPVWRDLPDLMKVNIIKQNNGDLNSLSFLFDTDNFRISRLENAEELEKEIWRKGDMGVNSEAN